MSLLDTPLNLRLPAALAKKCQAAGLHTVGDLLYHAPRRYYHWGNLTAMRSLRPGEDVSILARVVSATLVANRSRGGVRLEVALTDGYEQMTATFFGANQYKLIPHQRLLTPGSTHLFAGKIGTYRGRLQLTHPQFEEAIEGDEEAARARQERPIPIYPLGKGLTPWVLSRAVGMILDGVDDEQIPDCVPADIRRAHNLLSHAQALRLLHQPDQDEDYQAAQRTLAWQEAFVLQVALAYRRRTQEGDKAPACPAEGHGSRELLAHVRAHLPFILTPSQEEAWGHISADLGRKTPMMRLLQGDVGSGKTVIALLALAQVVGAGHQGALMVPTEVLAEQHASSLRSLIPPDCELLVEVLTGTTTPSERARIQQAMSRGVPMIVVGTHALIQDTVDFDDLALVIVDEQHRFGVAQRDRLRERSRQRGTQVDDFALERRQAMTPHQCVMTATPIPRTIAMTVFGDLEETRMLGVPPGRTPVATHLVNADNTQWLERLWARAREEIEAGGRVYVVCPRIEGDTVPGSSVDPAQHVGRGDEFIANPDAEDALFDAENPGERGVGEDLPTPQHSLAAVTEVAAMLGAHPALADLTIATLTSRTPSEEKQATLEAFARGSVCLLVATTVIEVGVNVPEATMMIIVDAQQFGLSQLHQLRGRVGRSTTPSICVAVHRSGLSSQSMARLEAFAQTTDGFELARADLKLRREGDVLGAGQSGRASSLRFLSVLRDEEIITQARTDAIACVSEHRSAADALSRYPALHRAVTAMLSDEVAWMERV